MSIDTPTPTTVDTSSGEQLSDRPSRPEPAPVEAALVEEELLVEEVSIDGMCGVY